MNKTLEKLSIKNKELVSVRIAEKAELEQYKRDQKSNNEKVDGNVVSSYRNHARQDARYHHVAYSLLKGNKYSEIERTCRDKLDPSKLLSVIKECEHSYDIDEVKEMLNE